MAISTLSKIVTPFTIQTVKSSTRNFTTASFKNWKGLNLKIPFEGSLPKSALTSSMLETIQLPYEGLMIPGLGINSLSGRATGAKVISHGQLQRLQGADATTDGQTSRTTIKVIESAQEMFNQISATMSGGGSYGIFSGSAGLQRSEMSNFSSQSSIIFASTSVLNAIEYFSDGQLLEEAKNLAAANPDEFVNRFGDSYIQGILRGGYYIAAISVLSESRDVQKKITASIKSSFTGYGSAAGSFNQELKAYSKFSDISVEFIQRGGVGVDHANLGANLESLYEKINRFAIQVHSNPVTFSVLASSYKTLLNFPSASESRVDRSYQREHLSKYELQRTKVIGLRNDIEFIQQHLDLFINPPSHSQLNEWQRGLADLQNLLERTANACISNSNACTTVPFTLPDSIQLPERIDNQISSEESIKLGTIWSQTEDGWTGIWRRIGQSRIFEAEWTKSSPNREEVERALLEIRITRDIVQIRRVNSHGTSNGEVVIREGECHYTGTLARDGVVTGEYSCDWNTRKSWSAKIS